MARHHRYSENFRSIAGGALVALGLHILFGNLDHAALQLKHISGSSTGETLGVLPSVVFAASQGAQAYAVDHQGFLLVLLRLLLSLWPLLLVIAGTVLLRDALTEKVKALPTPAKYFQNSPGGCRFRCPSFDA